MIARTARWQVALLLAATLLPAAIQAAEPPRAAPVPAAADASAGRWREECSACHIAYAPRLLGPPAWRQIMQSLDRHYGVDASLDADTARQVEAWLVRNAGTARPPTASDTASAREPPRITQSAWFLHEHDEVPAALRADPRTGRLSRCEACHQDAAAGRFDEHRIRMPARR